MDPDEDILFLYLTSHGAENRHIEASLPPVPMNDLSAKQLKKMLDRSGIKWRVIVISACYSGGFIDILKGENSLVITAARKDRTSFGCANGRDYTDFGKAYFDEALRQTWSFVDAFALAKETVAKREKARGYDPRPAADLRRRKGGGEAQGLGGTAEGTSPEPQLNPS